MWNILQSEQTERARIKGYKAFYSCSVFSFCRYIHFREICSRKMNSICFHCAANPQSSFFASGNPSRSSSIYCRFAPIRYEINPSFAQQTYRKSLEGFIPMRDLSVKDITHKEGVCVIQGTAILFGKLRQLFLVAGHEVVDAGRLVEEGIDGLVVV